MLFRARRVGPSRFRKATKQVEKATKREAIKHGVTSGESAPRCWEAIWVMCEALYGYATCAEGCPGESRDHTLRYIAGRATNVALGAVQTSVAGYYDNALLAVRALGEQANLTALLVKSEEALAVYKLGDKRERMRTLGPKAVRDSLAELGVEPIVSADRAGLLSQRVVHPAFDEIVLTHDFRGVIVGPLWQPAGFLLCLNEIAIALGGYIFLRDDPGATPTETATLTAGVEALRDGIGGVLIDNLPPGLVQRVPEHRWFDGTRHES
jgi:hypothetical protein